MYSRASPSAHSSTTDAIWQRAKSQLHRYSSKEVSTPSDADMILLYQDDFAFSFPDDQLTENDTPPGLTLGTNDEICYL